MLFIFALMASATAFSNGQSSICDVKNPLFGCKSFKGNDRTDCNQKTQIMDWVTFPVTDTSRFVLFSGPESKPVTTYVPGEWTTISIRAKKYNQQYRGILMHASDDKGDRIGEWDFVDREVMFHSYCPNTVLHGGAELKPYLTTFRLKVPANYRGAIKLEALLKVGPANTGEFYYSNDLTLTARGNLASVDNRWYVGKVGQSCDEVCSAENMVCDAAKLNNADSADKVVDLITPYVTCLNPPVARCGAIGLSQGPTGMCYYRNDAECTAAGIPREGAASCGAKLNANIGKRICPCKCNGPCVAATTTGATTKATTKAPTVAPTKAPPAATTTRDPKAPPAPATAAPSCTPGSSGCICDASGGCEAGFTCTQKKNTNTLVCVAAPPKCLYGNLGCPCDVAAQDCGSARFKCVDSDVGGTCIGATTDCADGEVGCACNAAGGCNDNSLECTTNPDLPRGFCTVAGGAEDVCVKGTLQCSCDMKLTCNTGLSCEVVRGFDAPVCIDSSVDLVVDADSGVVPTLAGMVIAISIAML